MQFCTRYSRNKFLDEFFITAKKTPVNIYNIAPSENLDLVFGIFFLAAISVPT